ncbi:uncharacterized protein LOC131364606 [Hemibagrus wyckioides]|uniref:uncharacterized protein LOC131364606 n=1 Tax=Hemibagrus wyckioides TaxID=337641 RepID=UPI00266D4B5C|nr:uncharacterized protein LOC131364606 [Hemibagrus wyckioides]
MVDQSSSASGSDGARCSASVTPLCPTRNRSKQVSNPGPKLRNIGDLKAHDNIHIVLDCDISRAWLGDNWKFQNGGILDGFPRRFYHQEVSLLSLSSRYQRHQELGLAIAGQVHNVEEHFNNQKICFSNLINIKLDDSECTASTFDLKLGLLNIRSLSTKTLIINELITDQEFSVLCLTETKQNEYVVNEACPPGYSYIHQPRLTGRGGGVAVIHDYKLSATQKPRHQFNTFEVLYTNLTYATTDNKFTESIPLTVIYRPPGPYSEFLSEFGDFTSNLVVYLDKALIVGDFNIHFDKPEDPLRTAGVSILDSLGVNQNVIGPTHNGGHTLDLIFTFGLNIENRVTLPQSEAISDHYLVSFRMRLSHEMRNLPRYRMKRIFTSATAERFTDSLPELSHMIRSPSDPTELDQATDYLDSLFRNTLDTVAPLKRKTIKDKKLAPWYNDHT